MERVRKLEIISNIASRLENELCQLKDWIRSELDVSFNDIGKDQDELEQDQDSEEKLPSSPPPPSSQLNDHSIEINPHIVIETMDIKNEIEDQEDEQGNVEENDEFILGGGCRSRLRPRAMSIDYSEFQSDFTKQEQEQDDDEEYQNQDEPEPSTSSNHSILNSISLSSQPFKYMRTRSRNRYNSFFNSNNENSPLKKLLSKLVHREKLPKLPKKPANFCTTCLLTFETHQLYKEHQQIHFKVPENHKFIESQRGNPLLEADGYYYRKTVGTPNAIYWQCRVIEKGVKCYARATSSIDGERIRLTGEHKHEKKPRKAPSLRTIKRRLKYQGTASTSEYLGANLGDLHNQNHESTSSSSSTSNYQQQQQNPAASSNKAKKKIEVLIPRDDFVHQIYGSRSQNSSVITTDNDTNNMEGQVSANTSSVKELATETTIEIETASFSSPKKDLIQDKIQQSQANISISNKIFNDDEIGKQHQDSPPIISVSDRIFNNSNSQQSTITSTTTFTSPTTTSNNTNLSNLSNMNMNRYFNKEQNQTPPVHSMPIPITSPSLNLNSSSNSTSSRFLNYYDQYNQHHHQSTNNMNLNMNRYFNNDQQSQFNSNLNRIFNNDYQTTANSQAHNVMNNNANSILDALNQQVNSYSIPPSIFDDIAKHHHHQS